MNQYAEQMPFGEVLAHLRARRRGAVAWFAAVTALSLCLAAILPSRFDATATLAVLPAPEFTVRQDAGSHTLSTSALAMDQVMRAETEILHSRDLHVAILHAIGPYRLYPALNRAAAAWPIRAARRVARTLLSPWRVTVPDSETARLETGLDLFASHLSILPAKDANVITVTFSHGDGALAAEAVNDLLAFYARRRGLIYDDPQLAVVRRETAALSDAVRAGDAALAAFKARNGIADFEAERNLLVRRHSAATQSLADATVNEAEQAARVAMLGRQIDAMPATVSLYRETDIDTRLQAVDASLVDLRSQVAAARVHYRDSSRKMSDLLNVLRTREADRARLARNPAPSQDRRGRNPALDGLLLDRARAATDQAAAAAGAAALRRQVRQIGERLGGLIGQEATLAELLRRKTVADAAFANASQVQAEQRMTEAEDALRLANVRVIQPARVPLQAAPLPLLVILAGGFAGAFAAACWCLGGLLIRPTLLTEEGLAQATGLPVLGAFSSAAAQRGYAAG